MKLLNRLPKLEQANKPFPFMFSRASYSSISRRRNISLNIRQGGKFIHEIASRFTFDETADIFRKKLNSHGPTSYFPLLVYFVASLNSLIFNVEIFYELP